MSRFLLSLAGITTLASPCRAAVSPDFLLVKAGQPQVTIVLSQHPTVAAAFASRELQDHVQKITGAVLPVVTDKVAVTGARVVIGESDATRAYGLKGSDFQKQEHLIQFRGHVLILIGRDKEEFCEIGDPVNLAKVSYPGVFDPRGSLNAVYDLLELYCGVHWYHLTDVGTVYPTSRTLAVKRRDLRRHSDMKSIRGYFHATYYIPGYREVPPGIEVDLWRLRMRMGGEPIQVDHSFYEYYDRFLKTHPEWFAKGYEQFAEPPQLCYTNPELIQQVVQDARDYFDGKLVFNRFPLSALPHGSDYFPLVPMDDRRWCQCDRCRAEFDTAYETDSSPEAFSSGEASNHVWGFINKVAKELKKTHPDKFVAGLAYHQHAFYPTKVKLEPNVAVEFCLWNARGWHIPGLRSVEQKIMDDWRTKGRSRPKFVRVYYLNPLATACGFGFEPFPSYFGHVAVRQMEFFRNHGISAMWMHFSSEMGNSHLYDVPDQYIAMRMAENAQLDGYRQLNEFFSLYYGAAAKPMKQLYDELEKTYTELSNYPKEWLQSPNVRLSEEISWGHLGTPERMNRWTGLLSEAQQACKTEMEKKRVNYFCRGVWQHVVKGAEEHAAIAERRARPFHVRIPGAIAEYGGDPSKVDWSKAVDIGVMSSFVGIPNPIHRDIQVRMIHDASWLYMQSLEDVDTSQLTHAFPFGSAAYTNPLFSDSFVFLVAPKNQNLFREIAVIGVDAGRTDVMGSGEIDTDWRARWKGISDKSLPHHWRVWIAMPLADLLPDGVRPGTIFRGNFYRFCRAIPEGMLVWHPHYAADYSRSIKYMGEMSLE